MMHGIRLTTTDPATGKRISAQGAQAAHLWQKLTQATQVLILQGYNTDGKKTKSKKVNCNIKEIGDALDALRLLPSASYFVEAIGVDAESWQQNPAKLAEITQAKN